VDNKWIKLDNVEKNGKKDEILNFMENEGKKK
jgi:hypothetical protein